MERHNKTRSNDLDNISISMHRIATDALSIQEFLMDCRCGDRIYIPEQKIDSLRQLFISKFSIEIDFGFNNPLSTMETVVLVLSLLLDINQIAQITMNATSTIYSSFTRIKEKIGVAAMPNVIFSMMREGHIKILDVNLQTSSDTFDLSDRLSVI